MDKGGEELRLARLNKGGLEMKGTEDVKCNPHARGNLDRVPLSSCQF